MNLNTMANLAPNMANRYTGSTLTKREQQTIDGCFHKLLNIWARRKDKPNEMPKPIARLSKILNDMIVLNDEIEMAKRQIEAQRLIE